MKLLKKLVLLVGIKVLFYLHIWHKETIKITFPIRKFNLITMFTLMNWFACFFDKNLLTLLVLQPPSLKDGSFTWNHWWLLPLFSFFHVSRFRLRWWLASCRKQRGMRVWQYFYKNIYVSGSIFIKLADDLNPSCLFLTFVKKIFSNRIHETLRALHQAGSYSGLDCFVFHIVFTLILKLFYLFFWLTKGT